MKKERNLHYKKWYARLSDEVILELKNRRLSAKSWNLAFEKMLGIKDNKKDGNKKVCPV